MLIDDQMKIKKNIEQLEGIIVSEKQKLKSTQNTTTLFLGAGLFFIIGTITEMSVVNIEFALFYLVLCMSLCTYLLTIFIFLRGYRRYEKSVRIRLKKVYHTIKVQKDLLKNEEKN